MLKTSLIKTIFVNKICISCLRKIFNSFFVFCEWITSTISKTRCFKCISGINLSPANKNLSTISFILYTQNKTFIKGILLNGVLIPKLLNNPFVSCSFTNLDFLIPQSTHFDCIINLLFFVLKIFESKFSFFFLTLSAISQYVLFYKKSIKN